MEELTQALHTLAGKLYQAGSKDAGGETGTPSPTEGSPPSSPRSGPGPVDADFRVVDGKEPGEEKGGT
jgi:hypothetical protein